MFESPLAPGLTISPVMPADAEELFALVEQERDRLSRWFAWTPVTRTIVEAREFIGRSMAEFGAGDGAVGALRVNGRIVGITGAHRRQGDTFEIGYWLAAGHEGRGHVTAAVAWLVDRTFQVLRAHRIVIRTEPENGRSQSVALRLGFTEDGLIRGDGFRVPPEDLIVHTLFPSEWPGRDEALRRIASDRAAGG